MLSVEGTLHANRYLLLVRIESAGCLCLCHPSGLSCMGMVGWERPGHFRPKPRFFHVYRQKQQLPRRVGEA